jgi:hypothetical protein
MLPSGPLRALLAHRLFPLRWHAGQTCSGIGASGSSGGPSTNPELVARQLGFGTNRSPHNASTWPSPPSQPRCLSWSASDRRYQLRTLLVGVVVSLTR